ncbi:epidermal growth factor receptor-like isoform X3 [Mytilus trossulus]|uniref:epidermal growth factor receptor-like isoform X1 n=2 Tax=Mytilus trossulus TaxID=6551 RepID=UPI003003F540
MALDLNLLLYICILFGICFSHGYGLISNPEHVVCRGTKMGMSVSGTSKDHYDLYKRRYTNCTYVDGNLEITYLDKNEQGSDWDLTFLESIEEVSGYVLIYSVFTQELHLKNLRLIRGSQLFSFKGEKLYSLVLASNSKPGSTTKGLMHLGFKSLQEIMNGIVYFYNNNLLCFEQTIHWADINPSVTPHAKYSFNNTYHKRSCGECHPACYNTKTDSKQCWGEGPDMCQTLNHASVCSQTCEDRCFGSAPNQCCHPECAAGCNGPKKTDCYACKHYSNDNECVSRCPPHQVYNPYKLEMEESPDGKFAYGALCQKDCPKHLLKDKEQNVCVKTCRTRFHDVNGTCVECNGPCPKACTGQSGGEYITAKNINQFENCTIINGNLKIVEASFAGDTQFKIPGITVADLQILKSVKEVTGYIMIQSNDTNFRNLSFLSNLEVIHGREVDATQSALNVMFTPLKTLDLTSLRQIKNGHVTIAFNHHLCYLSDINFTPMFVHKSLQVVRKMKNKKEDLCKDEGEVCDQSCSDDGCWFKGPDKCLQCRNFKIDNSSNICINDCSQLPWLYQVGNLCKFCDEECESTCSGLGPENCHKCKHNAVTGTDKDGNMIKKCLKQCPEMFYPDQDKICQKCNDYCDEGCTGLSPTVMIGGCNSCNIGIEQTNQRGDTIITCMDPNEESCPIGFYRHTVSQSNKDNPLAGKTVCKRCHEMCTDCTGSGSAHCITCKYLKQFDYCVDKCYPIFYPDSNNICQGCHEQCRDSCYGPSAADCNSCKNFKVYWDDTENLHRFNCTEKCPEDKSHHVESEDVNDEGLIVCAGASHPRVQARLNADRDAEKKKILAIAVPTVGGILLVAVLLVLFAYYWKQRAKSQEKTAILTARMTGYEDEPITPTDAKPDMSSLRLIKESELRRGGIIGSGAFGTVYKGFWIPDNENVKIPVAIKVLQEGTSPNLNKELLEEARVMSSVDNVCCIRILAVCMTAQMMLITQLMPLGCLLDYVRKHKENVGSKVLLNWATQIARGMAYLEERGIVHRDLAARNVLVQSPGQIKITDFGLAKLLDYNEDEYVAGGGKMPIKWLALECIQHRVFTHKSDVWSYGVTIWELFTYGQKPYEHVRARNVPEILEKGERLPQPNICTIDVYMIMIKCWMLDAESRPSFIELADEFAKMARDPGRYLVIQGDVNKKIPDEPEKNAPLLAFTNEIDSGVEADQTEGDKLMRLPSHSYDKNDLARSLSVAADGPEELMEADDYLQPQSHEAEAPVSPVSIKAPLLELPEGTKMFDKNRHYGGPPFREKRYAHLDSALNARQQREMSPRGRGDSINSRYSSDPVQVLQDNEDTEQILTPQRKYPTKSLGQYERHKNGDVKIRLPVDEDDYLQPKSSHPRKYMDLLEDPDYINENKPVFDDEDDTPYMKPDPVLQFHNPEYFDSPVHTNAQLPRKSNSSDYYNDMKVNGTELKPLMIVEDNSETTV